MIQQYAYSPDTGELIRTETPADWMGVTDVPPPAFDRATAGCFWRGSAWEVVVPAPDMGRLKADKLREINAHCEAEIAAIRAGYPDSEVLSWPKQEMEARAFTANASAATPLLDALATARGIPKTELAGRIIAKADLFAAYSGGVIGKRQALEDALNALPANATASDVAAIQWQGATS